MKQDWEGALTDSCGRTSRAATQVIHDGRTADNHGFTQYSGSHVDWVVAVSELTGPLDRLKDQKVGTWKSATRV